MRQEHAGANMGGEDSVSDHRRGARVLVLRADGCRLCVALDVVDGMFPIDPGKEREAPRVETVRWRDVTGVNAGAATADATSLVVVRTPNGPVGLAVDDCIGVRDVSFLESPPIPTRWTDASERPLSYLLLLDGTPHVLVEPRAFVQPRERSDSPSAPTTSVDAPREPATAMGEA